MKYVNYSTIRKFLEKKREYLFDLSRLYYDSSKDAVLYITNDNCAIRSYWEFKDTSLNYITIKMENDKINKTTSNFTQSEKWIEYVYESQIESQKESYKNLIVDTLKTKRDNIDKQINQLIENFEKIDTLKEEIVFEK